MQMRRSRSVGIACLVVVAHVALGPASALADHGTVVGNTWYSNGRLSNSGPAGTFISVFASGAQPNLEYQVGVQKVEGGRTPCGTAVILSTSPIRLSNGRGFIATTTVAFDEQRTGRGWYWVCFVSSLGDYLTAPVYFALT